MTKATPEAIQPEAERPGPARLVATPSLVLLGCLAAAGIVGTSVLIEAHVSQTKRAQAAATTCAASGGHYLDQLDALMQRVVMQDLHAARKGASPMMAGSPARQD